VKTLELLKSFRAYYVNCALGQFTPEQAASQAQDFITNLLLG